MLYLNSYCWFIKRSYCVIAIYLLIKTQFSWVRENLECLRLSGFIYIYIYMGEKCVVLLLNENVKLFDLF